MDANAYKRVGIFHFQLMKIEDCFKVGFIMKPHGLKGQVTVSLQEQLASDDPLQAVFVEENNRLIPYFVQEISVRGDKAYVKFEDVDTPEAAEALSKKSLYLPKKSRPASGRGEFYDDEVVGFEVVDSNHGAIGSVREVTSAGANKLLVVSKGNKDEVLIPLNSPFITNVNKKKKVLSVELPEGYLEI